MRWVLTSLNAATTIELPDLHTLCLGDAVPEEGLSAKLSTVTNRIIGSENR